MTAGIRDAEGRDADGPGRPRRERRHPAAGPAPTEALLREAALAHLARFSATEAGLARVLARRVARWAARAGREGVPAEAVADAVAAGRAAALSVARALVSAGAVDDAAFAAARARRLLRTGRSRRAALAHLAAKGVGGEVAAEALAGAPGELGAALAHLRRRRRGPFDPGPAAEEGAARDARLRDLAALARAGFPRDVAERALDLDPAEAEARLIESRRG